MAKIKQVIDLEDFGFSKTAVGHVKSLDDNRKALVIRGFLTVYDEDDNEVAYDPIEFEDILETYDHECECCGSDNPYDKYFVRTDTNEKLCSRCAISDHGVVEIKTVEEYSIDGEIVADSNDPDPLYEMLISMGILRKVK